MSTIISNIPVHHYSSLFCKDTGEQDDFDRIFGNCAMQQFCWADEVEAEERRLEAKKQGQQQMKLHQHQQEKEISQKKNKKRRLITAPIIITTKEESFGIGHSSLTIKKSSEEEEKEEEEKEKNNQQPINVNDNKQQNIRMLFVGGIMFDDLEKHPQGKELKAARIKCMEETLRSFGHVVYMKARWNRRYCHIIYANEADAQRAFEALNEPNARRDLKAQMVTWTQSHELPTQAAPTRFYARWPKKTLSPDILAKVSSTNMSKPIS